MMQLPYVENLEEVISSALSMVALPTELTLNEWTEEFAYLSAENSAEPGKWHTIPYQRGMLDAITDEDVERATYMKSARVGYTKIIDHAIGYYIHHDPSPILCVQPTLDDARDYSKTEIAPMLRDTPVLRGLVADPRAKDSDNTILKKKYPGGSLTLVGANSPTGFRRLTKRIALFDEIDGYPVGGAGSEGDQIKLGIKRTETYSNRKIVVGSTPTIKGFSRIEREFEKSDKRYYFVPCPHCNHKQRLMWANFAWDKTFDENGEVVEHYPETAHFICQHCGAVIEEKDKSEMLEAGEWRATRPFRGHAGFHIWAAYSVFPNASWGRLAAEFLEVKNNPETLQVFVNTVLGETWEEQGESAKHDELLNRREGYGPEVPFEAGLLTAGADVQDDRIEVEVLAWGLEGESWSMGYDIFYGDPSRQAVWDELDAKLLEVFRHESGRAMRVKATCVDSGGHFTDETYNFCKRRYRRNVWAIKGASTYGNPIANPMDKKRSLRGKPVMLGVDTAKDTIHARLKVDEPGPGYCHFPEEYDEEFFKQLTGEKRVTKYVKGVPQRRWVKKSESRRVEALDCRVYNLAAYALINPNMKKILEKIQKQREETPPETEEAAVKKSVRRRSMGAAKNNGFVNGW